MNKKSILSTILLSTLILSQAAPVFATVQEKIAEPTTELVTETPTVETENNAEAPPIEENTESEDNSETLEKISNANLAQITEKTFVDITPAENTTFNGGAGTVENPYLIATAEELNQIRNNLRAHYQLVADIDLSAYQNWTPIGSSGSQFYGSLDGAGYTISNLTIARTATGTGLFGYANNAKFSNLSVKNAQVSSTAQRTGILAGYIDGNQSSVNNVHVSGNVQGSDYVGGIAGSASGTIERSSSSGSVTATSSESYAGGVVGILINSANIYSSHSSSTVSGNQVVGGVVGQSSVSSTIEDSYATGHIIGYQPTGGICGYSYQSSFRNNLFLGKITTRVAGSTYWGAVSGYSYNSTYINNYRYAGVSILQNGNPVNMNSNNPNDKNGGILTAQQLRNSATFSSTPLSWLNNGIWTWDSERNLPILGFVGEEDHFPSAPVHHGKTIDQTYAGGAELTLAIDDIFSFDADFGAVDFDYELVTKADDAASLSRSGDNLTLTFGDKRVGTYQIQAVANGRASRLLQSADIATINIKPKEISFNRDISLTRAYDGTADFSITSDDVEDLELMGVFEEDDVDMPDLVGLSGTHMVDGEATVNVSSGILEFEDIQLSGDHAMNYSLTQPTINTEITRAAQTVTPSINGITRTTTSLTVDATVTGDLSLEYALDGGEWQESPNFTGLNSSSEYTVSVRVAETQNHSAGSSVSETVTTLAGVTAEAAELVYAGRTQDLADLFDFADGLSVEDYDLRLLEGEGEIEGAVLNFDTVGTFKIGAFSEHNAQTAEAVLSLTLTPRPVTFTGTISLTKPFDGTDFFGNVDGLLNNTLIAENLDSFENVVEGDHLRLEASKEVSGRNASGSNASPEWSHLVLNENQEREPFMLMDEQTNSGAENYVLQEKPVLRTMITQATRDDQLDLNLSVESFSHNHVTLSHTLTHLDLADRLMTPMNFMSLTRAETDDTPKVEYAYSETNSITGVTWQTSSTFTDLQPDTTYHFFARVAETNNFHATAHEVLSLRTNALGDVTVPEEIEDGTGEDSTEQDSTTVPEEIKNGTGEGGTEQNFTTGAENVSAPKNLPSTGESLGSLFGLLGMGVLAGLFTWLRQRKN